MTYEILNILNKVGDKWEYTGQIIDGAQKIAVSGTVEDYPTSGQIKKAIVVQMEAAVAMRQTLPAVTTKVLGTDAVFKNKLTVAL